MLTEPPQRELYQPPVEAGIRPAFLELAHELPRDAERHNASGDIDPIGAPERLDE